MRQINFKNIRNDADIALHFECSKEALNRLIASPETSSYYQMMRIPKKNKKNEGKYRTVYKPIDLFLELLQKNITTALDYCVDFSEHVQGFVRKRSIVTNAKKHLAKKYVLNIDIKNFFESVSYGQVVDAFIDLGCNAPVANTFAKICTLNDFLPQGASSSPIVANLVCKAMDVELSLLAETYSATYTRYADDITFSGENCPSRNEIEPILIKNNFLINNDKYEIMRRGQNQYVTGLTVFDESLPRVPRKIKKYLRLVLYCASKYGLDSHLQRVLGEKYEEPFYRSFEKKRIKGWIDFVNSVEPDLGEKFQEQWEKLISKTW